jgi:hypothetical protein
MRSGSSWRHKLKFFSAGTPKSMVALFTALTAIGLAVYGLFVKGDMWDRYLWPLIFCLAVLLALEHRARTNRPATAAAAVPHGRPAPAPGRVALAAALATLAVAATSAITVNSDTYDAARWKAGQRLASLGVPAAQVDAGFEWVGLHSTAIAENGRQVAGAPGYETGYAQMFPGFVECALAASSPLVEPPLLPVGTVRYDALGFAVPEHLYLYVVKACPGA